MYVFLAISFLTLQAYAVPSAPSNRNNRCQDSKHIPSGSVESLFQDLFNAIDCLKDVNCFAVPHELLVAFEECKALQNFNPSCIFVCISEKFGLVEAGILNKEAVIQFFESQFETAVSSDAIADWLTGIKVCLMHYEAFRQLVPVNYSSCDLQQQGLAQLGNCIIVARNCESNSASKEGSEGDATIQPGRRILDVTSNEETGVSIAEAVASKIVVAASIASARVHEHNGKSTNTSRCHHGGCFNGYCWAYCGSAETYGPWCYTTSHNYSGSYATVTCSNNEKCSGCWPCAESCNN